MQLLLRWRVLLTGKPDLGHTHMAFWFPCMALQAECKSCWGSNPSCWIAASVSQGPDTANQSDILPLGSREKDLCQAPQMQFASVFWLVCAGHDISWGYGSPAPLLSETISLSGQFSSTGSCIQGSSPAGCLSAQLQRHRCYLWVYISVPELHFSICSSQGQLLNFPDAGSKWVERWQKELLWFKRVRGAVLLCLLDYLSP